MAFSVASHVAVHSAAHAPVHVPVHVPFAHTSESKGCNISEANCDDGGNAGSEVAFAVLFIMLVLGAVWWCVK